MMSRSRINRVFLLILFITIVGITVTIWKTSLSTKDITETTRTDRYPGEHLSNGLDVLKLSKLINVSGFDCPVVSVSNLRFPMCLYESQEDIFISTNIRKGSYWEANAVMKVVKLLDENPDCTFVDLGANLGAYSLPIAHLGRHVVAVEPNWNTYARLCKSVLLGKIRDNIDVLNCAISNASSTTHMYFNPNKNVGDSFMADTEGRNSTGNNFINVSIPVTTLDSIVPLIRNKKAIIKIDVQKAELKVFTPISAAVFFQHIDVPLILMEWEHLKTHTDERRRPLIDTFLEFFYKRKYDVYDSNSEKKLDSDWTKWSPDIYLKSQIYHNIVCIRSKDEYSE